MDGVWGSVCSADWDDSDAMVACKQMGYSGGAAYRPPKNFSSAILMTNVDCNGNESTLKECNFKHWNKIDGCDYYSQRAGVFCYNDTGKLFYYHLFISKRVNHM